MTDLILDELIPNEDEVKKIASGNNSEARDKNFNNSDSEWLFNGVSIKEIPKGHESFVYLFTNKINKKQYIGFKTTVSPSHKTINGKKKRIKIESDWKTYWSSSSEVLKDVEKYGKGNFIREIIAFTVNKAVGKYYEAYYQFIRGVLTDNKDHYYNGIINLRINQNGLKSFNKIIKSNFLLGDHLD